MQQTEKYKLNLIEKNDPFSPDPLNENARTLEESLARLDAADEAKAAAIAELDQRLQVFEVRKVTSGTYTGGRGCTVDVGFEPRCVIIYALGERAACGFLLYSYEEKQLAALTPTGFTLPTAMNDTNPINVRYKPYFYIAFG